MLTVIRERVTGWLARVILALLLLAFALWGAGFYGNDSNPLHIAKVNDQSIPTATWQRAFNQLQRNAREKLERDLTEEEQELLQQQALETVVNAELINQIVSKERLQISDNTLQKTILSFSSFQEGEAGFNRAQYERGLMSLGMDPAFFESQLRYDMLSEQLQSAVYESSFVLQNEIDRFSKLRNQRRDLRYLVIDIDQFTDGIEWDEEDIEKYYEENSVDYMIPEKFRIAYIDLNAEELETQIVIEEDQLVLHYEENQDLFDQVNERSVSQLIARISEDAIPSDVEKAEKLANEALILVEQGKSLDVIAETLNSKDKTDEEIKNKTGLDYTEQPSLQKGVLPEPVDQFVFSANEGDYSEPIKTELGFHIVKVNRIVGDETKNSFAERREEVEKNYRETQAKELFFEKLEKLSASAYEHPDNLEVAAEETGLELQQSDFFDPGEKGTGILANAKVLQTVTSDEVRQEANNSDVVELNDYHAVVLRIIENQPAVLKELSVVREQIAADMTHQQARTMVLEKGQKMLTELGQKAGLQNIIGENSSDWEIRDNIERNDDNTPRLVLRNAFSLSRPADADDYSFDGIQSGDGSYYVIIVTAVHDVADDEIDKELQQAVQKEISSALSTQEWTLFMQDARSSADVETYPEKYR